MLTLSPVLLALFFGVLLGEIQRSLLIIIPFVCLRKFSGGYHTKRAGTCLISSSLFLILSILLSTVVENNGMITSITIAAAVSLAYFSPLDNENRLLDKEEKSAYKKTTVILLLCFGLIELFFAKMGMKWCAECISIGLILTACLQYPCIIKKYRRRIVTMVRQKRNRRMTE